MTISYRRLTPTDAIAYRLLMLEAYTLHPDAFTSDVKEREALPIAWWEKRLDSSLTASEVVFAAIEDDQLLGVAGCRSNPAKRLVTNPLYSACTCPWRTATKALAVN